MPHLEPSASQMSYVPFAAHQPATHLMGQLLLVRITTLRLSAPTNIHYLDPPPPGSLSSHPTPKEAPGGPSLEPLARLVSQHLQHDHI